MLLSKLRSKVDIAETRGEKTKIMATANKMK
jgi:hypothetical protein